MKPAPFAYHRPETRDEVDALLAELGEDAKILAGGQSLIPILNMRLASPAHLVDINHLQGESSDPAEEDGSVVTGPLVRHENAEHSNLVKDLVPLLFEAMPYVAHPAIRSRGTVAGSIAHSDPAAELPAVLVALDGGVRARSSEGSRIVPAREFFVGPLECSLRPGEWLSEVLWPTRKRESGYAFEEFARRRGDYALCGVAVTVERAGHDSLDAAVSYLGVGDVPQHLSLRAHFNDLDDAVTELVSEHLDPAGDIHARPGYRGHLAHRLTVRALQRAYESTGEAA